VIDFVDPAAAAWNSNPQTGATNAITGRFHEALHTDGPSARIKQDLVRRFGQINVRPGYQAGAKQYAKEFHRQFSEAILNALPDPNAADQRQMWTNTAKSKIVVMFGSDKTKGVISSGGFHTTDPPQAKPGASSLAKTIEWRR
jgi:hypothetical protein